MKLNYDNNTLTFTPLKTSYKQGIIGFLLACIIFTGLSFSKIDTFIEKIPVIVRLEVLPFSEENLKKEMDNLNIRFKDVVYTQCIVEGASKTGKRWNNPIFINGNNFLGLKKAYNRPSTAIDWGIDNYCIYANWRDCLIDYSLYQAQNCKNINNTKEYLIFLKEMGYSVDLNYIALLNSVNGK